MNFNLELNTTSPVTLTGIKFTGLDGSVINPTAVTLAQGTGTTGWDTELFQDANQNEHTLTPTTSVIITVDLPVSPVKLSLKAKREQRYTVNVTGGEISSLNTPLGFSYPNSSTIISSVRIVSELFTYVDSSTSSSYKQGKYFTTGVYTSGSVTENSTLRFGFIDSVDPGTRWTSWRVLSSNTTPTSYDGTSYADYNLTGANVKLRERSSLANLYASQAPVITGIEIVGFSDTQDKVTIKADKVCQVVMYVMADDSQLRETNILFFARDSQAYAKEHTYYVPKFSGKNKIIAIPTLDSYSKDFEATVPLNSLGSYNYSTAQTVVSRYDEGLKEGKKSAYQTIYALGQDYGFSFNFTTRTDYGTPEVNAEFMQIVGDGQYIKASKEIFNRGASYGFTYDSSSTDKNYYFTQQVPYIAKLTSSGALEAYQSVYNKGAAYGFTYDNSNTDKSYYQSKESEFISKIDSFSSSRGYKTAYSELYTAGRAYEGITGTPVGGTLWVDDTSTNSGFASRKEEFIRHVYNTGYIRAKQETFDRGLAYGFDFRNFVNTSKDIADVTLLQDYLNAGASFIETVNAESKAITYNEVYSYINTRYGFTWDSTNAANLSSTDYSTYLSGLKAGMVARVNEASRVTSYSEAFAVASDYLFTYNTNSTDPEYLKSQIEASYKAAYNYGARAAYQDVYSKGEGYNFNSVSSYTSHKNPAFTLKTSANDVETTYFSGLSALYADTVRDYGAVSTYKSFFNLAGEYGFTFDAAQTSVNYYNDKKAEFLEIYSSGNYSEGIRFIFAEAERRYGFAYTFLPNKISMENQVVGMFSLQENKLKADAYRAVLDSMKSETFYNLPFTDSSNADSLKGQIVPNLSSLKNSAALEAYTYVVTTANSRTGYTIPASTNAATLKTSIIPMFQYVEDYKEADAYRRVHNYARNFLDIGYDFNDSTDPRVLENQVPALFDFLARNGGYDAYKYVHDNAKTMFKWNYYEDGKISTLKAQVIPMFDFIKSTYEDIESIGQPVFSYPNTLFIDIVLRRLASVVVVLIDKVTHKVMGTYSSDTKAINHRAVFTISASAFDKTLDVMVIPSPREE